MLTNKEIKSEAYHHLNNSRMLLNNLVETLDKHEMDDNIKLLTNEKRSLKQLMVDVCESVIKHLKETINNCEK